MDRFYNEDPENEKPFFSNHDNDDDNDDDDDLFIEEDTIAFIQGDMVDVMQVGIAQDELRHELLDKATKIASSQWFWSFRSTAYKMNQISMAYHSLLEIITVKTIIE